MRGVPHSLFVTDERRHGNPGRREIFIAIDVPAVLAARHPCAGLPPSGAGSSRNRRHRGPDRRLRPRADHHARPVHTESRRGLTPALGLTASVPQAGTCEVGARYYYRLRTNGTIVQTTNYFTTLRAPVDPGNVFFTVVGDWGDSSGGEARLRCAPSPRRKHAPLPLTLSAVDSHIRFA